MKKRITALLVMAVIILQCTVTFAADSKMLFTEVNYFSAKIYVCDTASGEAILKNVVPITGIRNEEMTADLEYTPLPLNQKGLYRVDGSPITMEEINANKLDAPVRILVAKNRYGSRILRMVVLR